MALPIGDLVLRGLNFVLLIIVLGLTGSLAATTVTQHNPQVNFAIFAAAFGLLFSSFYGLLASFIAILAWPIILTVLEFLNVVFTLAAAAALATAIRVHSCTNEDYLDDNKIAQGSTDRCRKAQASTAFLFFSFFIFLVGFGFQIFSIARNGAFGYSSRKRPSTGVPTVTQV